MGYSMVDQRDMGRMNQRVLDNSMMQLDQNRINQDQHRINQRLRDNMMERNQMQSRRMIKREAGPSFAYTISTGHPSEESRQIMKMINYQMPFNMFAGSRVDVRQGGQGYGFRTMA